MELEPFAIAWAWKWQEELESGEYSTIEEFATAKKSDVSYVKHGKGFSPVPSNELTMQVGKIQSLPMCLESEALPAVDSISQKT